MLSRSNPPWSDGPVLDGRVCVASFRGIGLYSGRIARLAYSAMAELINLLLMHPTLKWLDTHR